MSILTNTIDIDKIGYNIVSLGLPMNIFVNIISYMNVSVIKKTSVFDLNFRSASYPFYDPKGHTKTNFRHLHEGCPNPPKI